MDIDNLTARRLVVAWTHSVNLKQVVRLLGPGVSVPWVRRAARHLRRAGAKIEVRPSGVGLLGRTFLFRTPGGDFVDLAGRETYRVGTCTLIEGPWDCDWCGDRMFAGYCVLAGDGRRHRHLCRACVRVE